VFLWPNVALNPNMTSDITLGDFLGSLFAKLQNGRQIGVYLLMNNKSFNH